MGFHILDEEYRKYRTGLYCDDGLACLEYTCGPEADRIRKRIIKIFKEDFILTNKPDNNQLYINIFYNHLPNITNNLLNNISKGTNNLSTDETNV